MFERGGELVDASESPREKKKENRGLLDMISHQLSNPSPTCIRLYNVTRGTVSTSCFCKIAALHYDYHGSPSLTHYRVSCVIPSGSGTCYLLTSQKAQVQDVAFDPHIPIPAPVPIFVHPFSRPFSSVIRISAASLPYGSAASGKHAVNLIAIAGYQAAKSPF
ncbi:hypothetical protein TWF718_004925 [Orbilia javanica]|uniref:Uncharacterized protein n=1 Tax=Orbilia javanica TaxID=47235 RepID=A0AAN8NCH2_9PEZI